MYVLVACEFSRTVANAFVKRGHRAVSCDLLPSETDGEHYQGDVLDILGLKWDLMIAFPPCTHLAVSGARWWKDKQQEQKDALQFVYDLMSADIPKIAIENPIGIISTAIRKPDQIIQPWQFGHGVSKSTCLWLKGLPLLVETNVIEKYDKLAIRDMLGKGEERRKERSRTFQGIADAMAEQWG